MGNGFLTRGSDFASRSPPRADPGHDTVFNVIAVAARKFAQTYNARVCAVTNFQIKERCIGDEDADDT